MMTWLNHALQAKRFERLSAATRVKENGKHTAFFNMARHRPNSPRSHKV